MAMAPDNSRQVRRTVLTVVFVVIASFTTLWLLYALRAVLLLLTFAIIFSYLIAPLVDVVERLLRFGRPERQPPRALSVSIVYLFLIVVIASVADRFLPLLSEQLSAFRGNVPDYARQLDQYIKGLEALPSRYRLPTEWRLSLTDWISTTKLSLFDGLKMILDQILRLARFLPWLVLIPVISFFFLKDGKTISNAFLLSLPQADVRHRVTAFLKDVSVTLAAYIRAQLIACFVVGVIEGTGLWLLGVSYPLVFAVGAGLFEVVPIVGPLALGVIAVLVASFHSWQSALAVAGFLAAYRIIHDYVIYPRLLSQGVEIHPLAIILAVLCGAELGGVTGVFLSVPVVALLIVCWRHWHGLQADRANPILAPDGTQMVERLSVESLIVEE